MERLILRQEDLYEHVIKAASNYKKSPKDRKTRSYIESRLEGLEKYWEVFTTNHYEIISIAGKADKDKLPYFTQDIFEKLEEAYIDYKSKLKDDFQVVSNLHSGPEPSSTSAPEVKLPQIQLPTFSGSYEEWQTFYDMFLSLIHNNRSLSAVQKLHYLKSSLSGEPETLLKNLPTIDTNYDEAWNQLTRRYNNKRYICNEIMKRLFSQKHTNESATSIKHLLDSTSACLKSLTNIGVDTNSWDAIIIHLVLSKLDQESRKQWEVQVSQIETDKLPTWTQLTKFLETRFRTLEMLDGVKSNIKPATFSNSKQVSKPKSFHSTVNEDNSNKTLNNACVMCEGQHFLYQCKLFTKQSPQERTEYVQSKRLCFNCLAPNHSVKYCRHSTNCRRCGRRHHSLLHLDRTQNQDSVPLENQHIQQPKPSTSSQPNVESERKIAVHLATEKYQAEVLLATAIVKAKSPNGYYQQVRALIDQGSEASFITEATVKSLGLKRIPVNGLISGVGDGQTKTNNMVYLDLASLHNPEFSIKVNAYVLSTLTSLLPTTTTEITDWPDIENLPLADPYYGSPGTINIILGVDVHSEIILGGLLKHPANVGPVAQNTQLGWILSGRVRNETSTTPRFINLHIRVSEDQLLKQFWEIEREPDYLGKRLTKEEMKCEEIFESTTTRDDEGRYVVRLPFKNTEPECIHGRSQEIALRRFKLLEKRLRGNTSLNEEYKKVVEDYLNQNHMEEVTNEKEINNKRVVYLPHHAVVKEDRETTKVRVVFDASCKGVNNVSLNDDLLVGPKLQQDLRHILMRWRRHPICIVADLVKMYRQVRVYEEDSDFQRILWRSDPNKPIQHFRLLRLTFGTACAPYLAVKSLHQLAKDEREKYPIASEITLKDYYMDDLLTGCETREEAIEIYEQMNRLMNAGGFDMQKWCSNSNELLDHIQREYQSSDKGLIFKVNKMVKVLGICWNKDTDNFEYTLQLPNMNETVTKRKVLSEIARLYDPMGWIAPVIIKAKVYIQKLWKSGLSWDEELTPGLLNEWKDYISDLTNVKKIIIPRWVLTRREDHVELHAFADASQVAYAAAVYIKTKDDIGNIHVRLVTAKTKVAPIEKEISIPRLELCAALLATKLLFEVSQVMQVTKENLYAWSDSTVVLAWLRGEPSRWTTFVSNRVSEILTMTDKDQWNHIKTEYNPADCASRGISATLLHQHDLWWQGPDLLYLNEYTSDNNFTTDEEKRPSKTLTTTVLREDEMWLRFSTLMKTLRVLAYCKKFMKLKLPKEERAKICQNVDVGEMEGILKIWISRIQEINFVEELKQLKSQKSVFKKSPLHTLCPILDENGILRVGGRISQSSASFDTKHPIILPSESHLTKLIILDAHVKTLHGGPQLMLNFLRTKYWIIRARECVKKCYRNCVTCVRYAKQKNNQLMGQLPEVRLKPSKPFLSSGVDFTGHINIRFSPGRGSKSYKGYICVFICLCTKAIHLEAVSDLSTQGFIAAFRRFVSRRGHCKELYSDNGTNFVGANRELRKMLNQATSELPAEMCQLLANEGTTWHFIPPHAPNFGGLWEAGVRSTKTHLKRIIGDSTLTFEELSTVLTQIEACLNSRPLSYLSDNPHDPLPLTPGHFLVGEPLVVISDKDYSQDNISGLQRWKLTQKMVNDFWRKWSNEYLVTLNQRFKWTIKKSEPEVDDVVIIQDHNLPPAKWLLGRVVEKHPGKDNITRVVTIKTKTGLCKRPCNKLCYLPKS